MAEPVCYGIALGSNLGDRLENFRIAVKALLHLVGDLRLIEIAPVYETAPVDCPPGSQAFLNTVIEVQTSLEPRALHQVLQEIEVMLGRPAQHERNAPRPLDLDILYASDQTLADERLTVPHPRLHLRRFVLQPLTDIRPDLKLPGQQAAVRDLLAALVDEPATVTLFRRNWLDART